MPPGSPRPGQPTGDMLPLGTGRLALSGVERRLTAILTADVAGYSRLTGLDEEGTQSHSGSRSGGRQPGAVMLPNLARRRLVLLDNVVFQICS